MSPERHRAQIRNVDSNESRHHEKLESWNTTVASLSPEDIDPVVVVTGIPQLVSIGPLVARCHFLGDSAADAIFLKGLAQSDVTLDSVNLQFDGQDGSVEGEEQDAIEE